MVRWELELPAGHRLPVGEVPVSLGRGPGNQVVLQDQGVSWHHAQVWLEGGGAWVRDLGSRNGTRLNEERLAGATPLRHGDRLGLGPCTLRVHASGDEPVPSFRWRYVEDPTSGVRILVSSDRFRVGSGPDCHLRVEGPAELAVLTFHEDGEVWVGTLEGDLPVEPGTTFLVGGRPLRLVEEFGDRAPTMEAGRSDHPHRLAASGSGPAGPEVLVSHPTTGREVLITGNKGVLLYVLARRLARDREAGLSESQAGWCSTEEVMTGVWGRGARGANHLNVLVHRLREQLSEGGIDPWLLEKRRGGIRVRAADVAVT